jgi:hypothetical protein
MGQGQEGKEPQVKYCATAASSVANNPVKEVRLRERRRVDEQPKIGGGLLGGDDDSCQG